MYSIINKWGNDPKKSVYIFPFLKPGDSAWEHEKKKKNLTKLINKRMKMIGEKLNLGKITQHYWISHLFGLQYIDIDCCDHWTK